MNSGSCATPDRTRPEPCSVVAAGEMVKRRMLRALAARERYRYVQPELHETDEGWVVTSPCCSRNVDPDGGIIDIARLQQDAAEWLLYSRDHRLDCWVLHSSSPQLDVLLQVLCLDDERLFWP